MSEMNPSAEKREFRCPLCAGPIEAGFVMDRMHGGQRPAEWIAGEPVESFWRGTNVSNTPHRHLEAFRCAECGYVMLFARRVLPQ